MSSLIRAHRKQIGTRWRALDPAQQAQLTLAHLDKGERLADLAAGFGISAGTASRRMPAALAVGVVGAEHTDLVGE